MPKDLRGYGELGGLMAALGELEMGHEIAVRREYTQEMGRGQAILHNSNTATNYAASDPRADGAATPEPIVT